MKRYFLSILAAALAVVSCGQFVVSCAQREITVLSYNVGVFSKYSEDSTPEVAEIIRSTGASYVALNELDSCNGRHNEYQLKKIAMQVPMPQFRFARAIPYRGGAYGIGVLCGSKIEKTFRVALPRFDGAEDRALLVVETPDMVFGTAHLDYLTEEAYRKQAEIVNDWFAIHYTGCDKPVIFCGDMNCEPQGAAIAELSRLWDVLTPAEPTHGRKCIDYIFSLKTARPVKVLEAKVIDNTTASDHRPVMLRFKPAKARKSLTFVHASDTQIGFHDTTACFAQSDSLMAAAVEWWNAMNPAAVFVTGDLINNWNDSLQNAIYMARKAQVEAPVYEIPGNHDIRKSAKTREHYLELRGTDHFSVKKDGCAFIGFDTNCIKNGQTELEQQQLEWLRAELAAAADCSHRILFVHCPVIRESIDEAEDYFNFPIPKREEYISLFKEYGVEAVFAGHTHMDYCTVYDGILFAAAGPVGNPLERGYSGFAVVNVSDGGIQWEYVATATPAGLAE